jgi:divalent metal cation (Fe/Co/Zn/Cd) transporter
VDVSIATIVLLLCGTLIKFILMMLCYKHGSPNAMVLLQDQRNDVLTNIVALSCGIIGTYLWIYADPIGAILVRLGEYKM